jgi:hypothetical protein
MNKVVKMAMFFVALATVFSFAQDGVKFGVRAGFSLYDLSFGDKENDEYVNIGHGFGGGLAVNIPIASFLNFAPEVSFIYRKPMTMNVDGFEAWISEFAISIPAMLQFMPIGGVPLYLAAGVQLDIPIASERTTKVEGVEATEDYDDRASIDFGIPLGLGYLITPSFGIDVRAVIGITNPDKKLKDSGVNQYGLGLTYFF